MVQITNVFERCVALLASQFQIVNRDGSLTNFQKMLYAICTQTQLLEDQLTLLKNNRWLNTAQGVQLDGLGQIVGIARLPGQSDASYREDIQFKIFVNQSSGTPEQMIYILGYLTNATMIIYTEVYPAAYMMSTNGLLFPANPADLVSAIQNVSPAGVNFLGIIAIYNTYPFNFSTDPYNEQLFVAPVVNDPSQINPFQVNPGSGAVNFFVNRGEVNNPDFGGHFAEALGLYPDYTYDNTGAGQFAEFIQTNGNLPPPQ